MKTALRVLGSLWLLPVALPIWLFYLLPFWAWGMLSYTHRAGWNVIFTANTGERDAPRWWRNAWARWGGHTMPFAIVMRYGMPSNAAHGVLMHEMRHAEQWLVLGPLFPIVYLTLLWRFGYAEHPMEVDADVNASLAWARRG